MQRYLMYFLFSFDNLVIINEDKFLLLVHSTLDFTVSDALCDNAYNNNII